MWEYIILGVVILGAIIGYIKGFLSQISSLIGLFIGYVAASLFSGELHQLLVKNGILSTGSSLWVSFILTIVLVIISIKFLSGLIESLLKSIGLNFTNKFAGMILGAAKYFCILMVLFYFLYSLGFINEKNTSKNLIDFISLCKTIIRLK